MIIREERPEDIESIRLLTELAFRGKPYAGGDEQDVIDRLRAAGDLSLSLVAIEAGAVIGQITFSEADIKDTSGRWMALGPVSVLPEHQSKKVGAALIEQGIQQISEQGALGCILTGNPDYYRRFGFEACIECVPENEPEEYFMLKRLSDVEPKGRFAFHSAFYQDS